MNKKLKITLIVLLAILILLKIISMVVKYA